MSKLGLRLTGWFLVGAAFFLAVVAALLAFSPLRYVVYADGDPLVVTGEYETVGDVIAAAGVVLSPVDEVSPPVNAVALPEIPIRVQAAREVRVTIDQQSTTFVSSAPTVGRFLAENQISLRRTDRLKINNRPLDLDRVDLEPLPAELTIDRAMQVKVVDGGEEMTVVTDAFTVGEVLGEAGVQLFAADRTTPPLTEGIIPGLTITLDRAQPVSIAVDGRVIETRSPAGTVGQVLAETGIGLIGYDFSIPPLNAPLPADGRIQVVRVTESFAIEENPIPYESLLQATPDIELDQRALLQRGIPGVERTRVRIRYENGVETDRTPDARWVVQPPVNEIVGYGTNIVIRTVDTEQGPREYWRKVTMRVTSYMAQTSGKPKDHPGYGITASGRPAGYGVVAIDPRVVPFRSDVFVPGYGVAFAGDTGGGVKGRWIDLGYEDNWDTFKSWNGTVEVYYLTPVPERVNYLIPRVIP